MIPSRDWNSYLKKIYESVDVGDNIQTHIESYQAKILRIGGPMLISQIHKLFIWAFKQGSLNLGLKESFFLFLNTGITTIPLVIGPLWLARFYPSYMELFWKRRSTYG